MKPDDTEEIDAADNSVEVCEIMIMMVVWILKGSS